MRKRLHFPVRGYIMKVSFLQYVKRQGEMEMKRKLGINTDCLEGLADELVTLELAHKAGFEAFTTIYEGLDQVKTLKEKGDALGMEFSFLHAPYHGINNLWLGGDAYRTIYDDILATIDSAAACGIPAVILHVSSGWNSPDVNDLGLARYDALVTYAGGKGVVLALENLRKVGNLACLMDRYEHNDSVRYCFDCGHEHCYTKTVPWLDIFTDKVVATHIHDNMGRPFTDKSSDRDTHLLPFDGAYNYHQMMRKLDHYGYTGVLLLEVSRNSREDYKEMSAEAFIATCYERIKRISELEY